MKRLILALVALIPLTNWAAPIMLPSFNTNLGTLTQVDIKLTGSIGGDQVLLSLS